MREIKFRAWDKDYKYMKHKVMVGNVWDEDNYHAHMIWVDTEDVDYECESGWMNFDEHSNIELMQYTGLKDKNGVDIYDGDVVHWMKEFISPADMRTKLKIDSNEEIHQKESGEWGMGEVGNTLSEELLNVEVIGNIYENPELSERETE